ncbi:hypothetical protein GYMLUDRAFT_65489 [Collybiopsis luxurians FD-317 M1]|uniref:Uncharacterized protein n=1 Tax=Collybiopsis luxurians FD-317 M1 TaxID=944289 RepID=A0A0D0AIE9_9AGAR|nr:hypothetical protein GYMLUDRAFT_65489 [Collybiopsis luxurians FD-317 M1]
MTDNQKEQLINKIAKLTSTLATKKIELTNATNESGRKTRARFIEKWTAELEEAQIALKNFDSKRADLQRPSSPLSPIPGEEIQGSADVLADITIHQKTNSVGESTLASEDERGGSIIEFRADESPPDPPQTSLANAPPLAHRKPTENEVERHQETASANDEWQESPQSLIGQPTAAVKDKDPVINDQAEQEPGMSPATPVAAFVPRSSATPLDNISSTEDRITSLINTLDRAIIVTSSPSTQNMANIENSLSRKIDRVKTIWKPALPKAELPTQQASDELSAHQSNDDSRVGSISIRTSPRGPTSVVADAKEMVGSHDVEPNRGGQTDTGSTGVGEDLFRPGPAGESNGADNTMELDRRDVQ